MGERERRRRGDRLVNHIGSSQDEGRHRERSGGGEESEKRGVGVERQGREAEMESPD